MKRPIHIVIGLALMVLLTGCRSQTLRREITFGGQRAIELSNIHVRAVIVPAMGRVMSFSRAGGENLLWVNPAPDGSPKRYGGWANFGGEKAWIWPQDNWAKIAGSGWPPKMDGKLFRETGDGPDAVRVQSDVIPGFGVRIERRFRLEPDSSKLIIETSLRPGELPTSASIAPWSVVQIPAAFLFEVPSEGPLTQRVFSGQRLAVVAGSPGKTGLAAVGAGGWKVGLDVAEVSTRGNPDRLTVRIESASDGSYLAGEKAQLYRHLQPVEGEPSHDYVEIEFTGPLNSATQEQRLVVSLEASPVKR
jgi:hypothetical protein